MKADIHPEYVLAHVTCSCGNEFWTRSTKAELHVEICAECHPFYTGKQKLVDTGGRVERFQRRLEKAGATRGDDELARMAVSYGGQAVLEGVMMRSPSSWAVAIRTPEGEITEVVQDITSPMQRRRVWRLPVIRGVIALGESLAIGFRALAISANVASQERDENGEIQTQIGRGQIIFSFAIAIGFALMLFKIGPALLTSWLPVESTELFVIVEGLIRVGVFIGYILVISLLPDLRRVFQYHGAEHKAINALEAGAELTPDERAEVQLDSSALRNGFFALGHGDRDLRLRFRRSPGLVLAHPQPDPAPAGDRRARVRAHPLRRQAPGQPRADDAARARPVASAPHDAASRATTRSRSRSRRCSESSRKRRPRRPSSAASSPASR